MAIANIFPLLVVLCDIWRFGSFNFIFDRYTGFSSYNIAMCHYR